MKLIDLVMGQNFSLQRSGAAHGVAVDLKHLCQWYDICSGIEVAGIGQQKLEGVADPAVSVDNPSQYFVVNAEIARVVGCSAPEANDFGTEFVAHLLRRHHISQAFAHFSALPVNREAVGQQPPVGRAVIHGAGGQQRAVEPASVLVMAFQVEVGLGPAGVAGAGVRGLEHRGVGGARVKPDLQNITALGVVWCISGTTKVCQDVFWLGLAPSLNAASFDHLGRQVHDVQRARVQFAAVLVQKKGQGHAPAALAADAPVGPVGNHVAQPAPPVLGVKSGLLNGIERGLAQGFRGLVDSEHALALVHAHKPLRRSAVNHWRFVAPAVRVAVGDVGGGKQPVCLAQHLDDALAGFPDVHAAKQRQLGRVLAVALHRVEDVVIGQPVRDTAVEIFHAIGRRGVHQPGAVFCGGVVGQVDRAEAVICRVDMGQRMVKIDAVELFAQGAGEHRAGQAVALQTMGDQVFSQQQQAAGCVDQRIGQRRVEVERLVGRQGPGGGGPDHGKGGPRLPGVADRQAAQAKGLGQSGRLGT